MAHHRRPPQHRVPSPPARTYPLRRSPTSRSRQNTLPDADNKLDIRPVLVPLHPNLRRLPGRLLAQATHSHKTGYMAPNGVHAGSKRKRVASASAINENAAHVTRSYSRTKRLRSDYLPNTRYRRHGITTTDEEENVDEQPTDEQNGEEDASSEMDIDTETNSRLTTSDGSEVDADENEAETASVNLEDSDDGEDDTDEDDSTDDHLLNSAEPKQLLRLRKHDLIRLYNLAGLTDDAEAMTKSDLVDAIVSAREDFADLPPSSPPGRGDGNSSDYYSSDDGNIAAGEETDIGIGRNAIGRRKSYAALKRRATMEEVRRTSGQPAKGRSMSMGHLLSQPSHGLVKPQASGRSVGHIGEIIPCKRRTSNRSSPSTSTAPPTSNPSPLVSRLRSRKVSATAEASHSPLHHDLMKAKGKGKGKQVEFSDDVGAGRTNRYVKHDRKVSSSKALESDLTDLEELEKKLKSSPRRLRNRSVEVGAWRDVGPSTTAVRRTPTRKAKMKIGSLKEEDSEEAETADDADMEDELVDEEEGGAEEEDVDAEEEEVDELVSSASQTPTPPPSAYKGRRTPLRKRLRPRKRLPPPPSDGDDEDELAEENEKVVGDAEAEDEEAASVMDEGDGDTEDNEDDEDTIAVEPRKLRNGKIVGEEDVEMDMVDEREEDEEGSVGDEDAEGEEGTDVDQDAQGDVDEVDAMQDDDIDLTAATAKTLIRLRRDDLIRLCETRNLEPVGTKPQLAEALLQWRDQHANGMSSPSSTGTIRPPSTKRGRRRHGTHARSSGGGTPPMLLHPEHMHDDEPKTPVPQKEKEPDPDLELDLESLGLEDREIPPDKLQKLEKIGSGGFKDVYIGKFKGRKIAIAEFRGQLSAMDIKELKLLGGFDHPNIVRFLGVSIPENTRETPVMIVSELCSNGDLFDYIRNVGAPSLHKVLVMMLDIARGLEYLHMRKPSVIHRDCKSSNILITAKGTAKIADFGLAKVKQSTRSMVRSLVGTVNWQAPELWHAHPKYNYKVDVFSCAMVYWEILQWHLPNKKFPWEGMNEHAIYEIVGTKRQRPSVSGLRKQWCPEIVDLIERMWAHDPQDRPTMSEVVEALEEMIAHY